MTATPALSRPLEILERPVFERLLFAQCWEDPEMDFAALAVRPGDVVLSVTSGGCNTLSLATLEPARIIAVDLNATQNFLLELKIAGARRLAHGEYLELLGVRASTERRDLYHAVRADLSPHAQAYWDTQRRALDTGLLRAGRYERYLEAFRRLLQLIEGPRTVERLFEATSLDQQRRYHEERWDSLRWRAFFRLFFSRSVLGAAGLDPRFFTFVNGVRSFGEHFRALTRHALTELPIRDNYFVAQICLGRYLDELAVPPYLRADRFDALRRTLDRIEIFTGEVGTLLRSLPDDAVDAFNYSNVFEWVPPDAFEAMLRETWRVGRPGARLCYRNLLVRRGHPGALDGLFEPHGDLAARLLQRDRSFVYSNFEVASVTKPARPVEVV
jgi:S-adenosylmethionine-diacylglycerol 3-amino-3-carboxypropyl transferase